MITKKKKEENIDILINIYKYICMYLYVYV